ncbi:MAG: hypothetical protein ABW328_09155 [Ilumatobacteraceae bacterium]
MASIRSANGRAGAGRVAARGCGSYGPAPSMNPGSSAATTIADRSVRPAMYASHSVLSGQNE